MEPINTLFEKRVKEQSLIMMKTALGEKLYDFSDYINVCNSIKRLEALIFCIDTCQNIVICKRGVSSNKEQIMQDNLEGEMLSRIIEEIKEKINEFNVCKKKIEDEGKWNET